VAAKDEVFDFMYEWFGKHKEPPTVRQVWKAATKAAEARFTSHNSDYATALRVRKEWINIQHGLNVADPFSAWCEERLNSAKVTNCA
jgi:hypothetical protein